MYIHRTKVKCTFIQKTGKRNVVYTYKSMYTHKGNKIQYHISNVNSR